jgi:hypothetical protein
LQETATNNTMKKNLFLYWSTVIVLVFLSQQMTAQKVYSTDSRYDADVTIYVTESKYEADLLVYKVSSQYEAGGNEGLWFFTESRYDADKKVYFTSSKYDADLLICFVDSKYEAGWRNRERIYLMY